MSNEQIQPEKRLLAGSFSDNEILLAEDDGFKYQGFADVLTDLVRSVTDTPLTIGILGEWGSGKTSLMRLIDASLKAGSHASIPITTAWLNVWELSNRPELWNAFAQALFTHVHDRLPFFHRLRFDWDLLLERVKWGSVMKSVLVNSYRLIFTLTPLLLTKFWPDSSVKTTGDLAVFLLNPLTGGAASLVLGFWLLVRPFFEAVRSKVNLDMTELLNKSPFEEQVSALQSLRAQFGRMVHLLVGKEGRLVIFVDDLDRCEPQKIPEVLEAIKLFTITRQCIYILGIDYDIVRQGLIGKYHFSQAEGDEYLEKIIQIPFQLPPLNPNTIADFIRNKYPQVIQECPNAPEVLSKGLAPNPRKVKRALNIYRTIMQLAARRVEAGQINTLEPELIAKIIVIQNRFRDLYQYLPAEPGLLPQMETWAQYAAYPAALDENTKKGFDWVVSRLDLTMPSTSSPLVPVDERNALLALLNSGAKQFSSLDLDDVKAYIFLSSTATGEKIAFASSPELTSDLQERLRGNINRYSQYLQTLGYQADRVKIGVRIDPALKDTSYYDPASHQIVFCPIFTSDADVVFREYTHHALMTHGVDFNLCLDVYLAIESGLADYFACSFTNDPILAEKVSKIVYKQPYVRDLSNTIRFDELDKNSTVQTIGGVWGALFWDIRAALGSKAADYILYQSWVSLPPGQLGEKSPLAFVKQLLNQAMLSGGQDALKTVREICVRRGAKLPKETGDGSVPTVLKP